MFPSATTSEGTIFSTLRTMGDHTPWSRRAVLLGSLLAGAPLGLSARAARAATIDRSETVITLPDHVAWSSWLSGFPPNSTQMATLYGGLDQPGPYLVLMKWYPGYMSAPHT